MYVCICVSVNLKPSCIHENLKSRFATAFVTSFCIYAFFVFTSAQIFTFAAFVNVFTWNNFTQEVRLGILFETDSTRATERSFWVNTSFTRVTNCWIWGFCAFIDINTLWSVIRWQLEARFTSAGLKTVLEKVKFTKLWIALELKCLNAVIIFFSQTRRSPIRQQSLT